MADEESIGEPHNEVTRWADTAMRAIWAPGVLGPALEQQLMAAIVLDRPQGEGRGQIGIAGSLAAIDEQHVGPELALLLARALGSVLRHHPYAAKAAQEEVNRVFHE